MSGNSVAKIPSQSFLKIRIGDTNSIDLCSSPPFKIALVPPRKVGKVILTRVVWLEATDLGVTEEVKPRSQMSHENEMISQCGTSLNCAGACGGV